MTSEIQDLEESEVDTVGAMSISRPVGKVIVVDDEPELRAILVQSLVKQGYDAIGYCSGPPALAKLREENFDVLLTDLMMPDMDGSSLLKAALEIDPHLVGIVMTGQGTIQTAVDAMKLGAFDYVLKPFRMQTFMPALTRAMNIRHLRLENLQLRETVAIHGLSQTIAFTLDPQAVLNKLADAALQQSDADEVSILLPTSDGRELYVAAVRGGKRARLLGERIPFAQSIASWVARERETVILNGPVHDKRFVAFWPRPEISSAISVPMQVANKLVGVINLNVTRRLRPFALDQMKALTILANTAAAALETASLYTQVRNAEERYRSIFENAVEGIFQATPDRRFTTVNPAMVRILGYNSPEEVIETFTDIGRQLYVNPEVQAEFTRTLNEGGVVQGAQVEVYRKDGEKIWLSLNMRLVNDETGSEICCEGAVEDITERKGAEDRLVAQYAVTRAIAESNTFTEGAQKILQAVCESLGWEHGGLWTLTHGPDLMRCTEIWQAPGAQAEEFAQATRASIFAMGIGLPGRVWTNCQPVWISDVVEDANFPRLSVAARVGFHVACGFPIWLRSEVLGVVEFFSRSIREPDPALFAMMATIGGQIGQFIESKRVEEALGESEEQLRQSQKLEAIGQLAGGVAHDFNNLLTVIGGYSSIILGNLPSESPDRSSVEEIKKASDRASSLTRQLLAFSRKQILQPKILDLNTIVSDLEKMVRRLIGEDIDLLALTDPELGRVKADPGQVEQVLLNLIVNARDAMPAGGKLTIQTGNTVLSPDYALRHAAVAGPYVMLAVSDTGCGMAADLQEHVFEPFFTTKGAGKGTGLGLATVYGIVKQSGGNVWLYSEVGKGTTFKIYLPRVDLVTADRQISSGTPSLPKGTETLLLVEDEEQVRNIVKLILKGQGYDVLAAANGEEALKIAAQHDSEIHLVITDVVMPQMSGPELADRLATIRPHSRVLYMSGYTDDAIVRHGLLDAKLNFIHKPFDAATAARKVREVLDS